MLIHLQFPLADLRGFLDNSSDRLPWPSWPTPEPHTEFVRYFGEVRYRPRGGFNTWVGETTYCGAERAVLFPSGSLGRRSRGNWPADDTQPLRSAFRRLYFDGHATAKLEVGFSTVGHWRKQIPLDQLVAQVMSIETVVPSSEVKRPRPLIETGKLMAKLYAVATTRRSATVNSESVVSEQPAIFILISPHDVGAVELPRQSKSLNGAGNFDLYFWRANFPNRTVAVWCARGSGADASLRELRTHLLNAEHQVLQRVLKAIESATIDPKPRLGTAQSLQAYLNVATKRIGRSQQSVDAYEAEPAALRFFDTAIPGKRSDLMARLRIVDVRHNILKKIEAYTAMQVINIGGTIDMSNTNSGNTITVSNSTNTVINSTLDNVKLAVGQMPGHEKERAELATLIDSLKDLLSKMPAEKAEPAQAVALQTEHVIAEASKEKPSPSILRVLATGLKEAAELVKDVMPAAATIVGQIISVIGKMHGLGL